MTTQSILADEKLFVRLFQIGSIALVLLFIAILLALGTPPVVYVATFAAGGFLWISIRHPVGSLGGALALMPVFPLGLLILRFFGPPVMMSLVVAALDRIVLFFLVFVLWRRNGIKLKTADWFLIACFGLAIGRFMFGGTVIPLLSDFSFLIAYSAGRVACLTKEQADLWGTRAAWIVAILSVVGMSEVFVFGEGPRTALYLSVAQSATDEGMLNGSFRAAGFTGIRESSTMFGPLQFASLCMVGLIIWWVYRRNIWIGIAIVAGLVCTVTRSAWLGTAVAIPVVAALMGNKKRLLLSGIIAVILFIVFIPVIGLGDYLSSIERGQDLSAEGHQESVLNGVDYVLDHPFGSGPGNAGMFSTKENDNGVFIENSYLTLAAEYGIPCALCFVGFLFSTLLTAWRKRTKLGYSAVGILIGFGAVMMVSPLHNVFSLASWVWFPVGLVVTSASSPHPYSAPRLIC